MVHSQPFDDLTLSIALVGSNKASIMDSGEKVNDFFCHAASLAADCLSVGRRRYPSGNWTPLEPEGCRVDWHAWFHTGRYPLTQGKKPG